MKIADEEKLIQQLCKLECEINKKTNIEKIKLIPLIFDYVLLEIRERHYEKAKDMLRKIKAASHGYYRDEDDQERSR